MNDQRPIPQPSGSHLDRLAEQSKGPAEDTTPETTPTESETVVLVFDASSDKYIVGLDNHNLQFVQDASQALNHVLQKRGNLFLNDLNDYLHLKRTPEGQLLGWLASDETPGRIEIKVEKDGDAFLLTPNLQGNIQPLI